MIFHDGFKMIDLSLYDSNVLTNNLICLMDFFAEVCLYSGDLSGYE